MSWTLEMFTQIVEQSSEEQFAAIICGPWSADSGVKINCSEEGVKERICNVRNYFVSRLHLPTASGALLMH